MKVRNKVRFTVGLTPEQASRLDELNRTRSRTGDPTSRADLVREAVALYLQHQPDLAGSRKAIAKGLEAKLDGLEGKVDRLQADFTAFVTLVEQRRAGK